MNPPNNPRFPELSASLAVPTPEMPLTPSAYAWLAQAMLFAIAWHIPHTPIWVLAAVPALLFIRYRLILKKQPPPSRRLILLLTIVGLAAVLLHFKAYMGRDPGIVALMILSALKTLEIKSQRDYMMVVYLCYFLVFGNFLYEQTMPTLAFMIVAVVFITSAILRLNLGSVATPFKFLLKRAFVFFLLSLPFMTVLFLLFPRMRFPMWNFANTASSRGVSGFNDSIYPGSVTAMAQSDQPAFRATFPDGNMPPFRDLYFRGVVLWITRGASWHEGVQRRDLRFRRRGAEPGDIRQEYQLEPHFRHWMFALDYPADYPRWARILPGHVIQSYYSISNVIRYEAISSRRPSLESPDTLSDVDRRYGLQLPQGWTSPIYDLGRTWRREASGEEEITAKGLAYFRDNGFKYSLTPGELDAQAPLEDFLFNVRRGFCEHFAASYALLMRSAGVPARVVLGYHGGRYNDVGNYLLVRQMDAHAWTEVWLTGRGWTRIDPTAAAAPDRLEFGAEISRSIDENSVAGEDRDTAARRAMNRGFLKNILRFLEQHWDNINNKWELWILSYNLFSQQSILRDFGLPMIGRLGLFLAAVILTVLLFVLISQSMRRHGVKKDPIVEIYRRFCAKTARKDVRPAPWEGPLDFRLRAIDAFPHKQQEIETIIDLYIQLRYGRGPFPRETRRRFARAVRRFTLR